MRKLKELRTKHSSNLQSRCEVKRKSTKYPTDSSAPLVIGNTEPISKRSNFHAISSGLQKPASKSNQTKAKNYQTPNEQ